MYSCISPAWHIRQKYSTLPDVSYTFSLENPMRTLYRKPSPQLTWDQGGFIPYFPSNTSLSFSAKGAIENGFWINPSAPASRMVWGGPSIGMVALVFYMA